MVASQKHFFCLFLFFNFVVLQNIILVTNGAVAKTRTRPSTKSSAKIKKIAAVAGIMQLTDVMLNSVGQATGMAVVNKDARQQLLADVTGVPKSMIERFDGKNTAEILGMLTKASNIAGYSPTSAVDAHDLAYSRSRRDVLDEEQADSESDYYVEESVEKEPELDFYPEPELVYYDEDENYYDEIAKLATTKEPATTTKPSTTEKYFSKEETSEEKRVWAELREEQRQKDLERRARFEQRTGMTPEQYTKWINEANKRYVSSQEQIKPIYELGKRINEQYRLADKNPAQSDHAREKRDIPEQNIPEQTNKSVSSSANRINSKLFSFIGVLNVFILSKLTRKYPFLFTNISKKIDLNNNENNLLVEDEQKKRK